MIKFRVWNKKTESFINYGDLMLDLKNGKVYAGDVGMPEYTIDVTKQVVLMQSTGLENKNGVEIYEGDIVRNEQHIYMVRLGKFTDSDYFQNTTQHQTGFYIVDIHTDETFPFYSMNYETIGNIYENLELLGVAE